MREGDATSGGNVNPRVSAFRERARLEADRYGPDPWIFVRELLQNSRDAGARQVAFRILESGGRDVVSCRDDGEGMSFAHARRYLFALYASSKEDSKNQAGKFGVGFWSVLRFEPETITIRSCPRSGEGWGLRLDGNLEHATRVEALETPGTEITVQRAGGDGRLEHRVYDAVWQSARYLHLRDSVDQPLPILVNGRAANAQFTLGAPSAAFRRGSVRGVVGLGPAPRVELFSRGLRVRSAACLEDLVAPTGRHTARMRVQFPELPGGLAPQALLESDELVVMLSRSDARDNRALNRLVKLAKRELERLIDQQLSQARPRTIWRRAWEVFSGRLRESLALRTALGAAMGAIVASVTGWWLWGGGISTQPTPSIPATPAAVVAVAVAEPGPRPYKDLGTRYRGPKVDVLKPGSAEPLMLSYTPASARLHFAALTFSKLAADGSPELQPVARDLRRYRGVTCDRNCIDVQVPVAASSGPLRIPVPTGHRIVAGSVTLDGAAVVLMASRQGHPTVELGDASGMLAYQAVAAADPRPRQALVVSRALPHELIRLARSVRLRRVQQRVDRLLAEVKDAVKYDRSPQLALQHAEALKRGEGFIARTLAIGAGDCDVQNGLLVALLHAAGVEARMAVGYVGANGVVYPWLHAWVEYRSEGGAWHIADASEGEGSGLPEVPGTQARVPPLLAAASPELGLGSGGSDASGFQASPVMDAMDAAEQGGRPVVAESETTAGTTVSSDASSSWLASVGQFNPWLLRGIPLLVFMAGLWSLLHGRTRRAVKLDDAADLSRLLQGVLQQPAAFSQLSALFTRPLVPLLNGDAISLNRARELAAAARLYRTAQRPELARRAARAKAAVIDARTPEGLTVADALGAVDLDRWSGWLENASIDALTTALNQELRSRGEDWGVLLSTGMSGSVAVLDIGSLGIRSHRLRTSRVVLVDRRAPWLLDALKLAETSPNTAAFVLLDLVTARLDLPAERRARLLSEGARKALFEAFAP